jgi:Ycf66 protein N-terminus
MLNFTVEPSTILGLQFGVSMIFLYLLRFAYPRLAFDEDVLFATLGLVYSCIIIIHGWRLDPILIFSQVLVVMVSSAAGLANLRLRGFTFLLATRLGFKLFEPKENFLSWTNFTLEKK